MRLHQFLSKSGAFGSKKEVMAAIAAGEIAVGNKVTSNPDFIFDEKKRNVYWKGRRLRKEAGSVYLMLNKPVGFLSSRLTQRDRKLGKRSVFELARPGFDEATFRTLICVGRLDEDTSGLLLITNDGRFASRVTDPSNVVPKRYVATLKKPLSDEGAAQLRSGVEISLEENGKVEKYLTRGCLVGFLGGDGRKVSLTLTEGRKREVRRMLEAVGSRVLALERVSIGALNLSDFSLSQGNFVSIGRAAAEKALVSSP